MIDLMIFIGASTLIVGVFICVAAYLDTRAPPPQIQFVEWVEETLDEDDIPTEEIVFRIAEDDPTEEMEYNLVEGD